VDRGQAGPCCPQQRNSLTAPAQGEWGRDGDKDWGQSQPRITGHVQGDKAGMRLSQENVAR